MRHQLDAALFAFKSPLSKGSILADEVGLGKTIEAGLVIARKWTEGKGRSSLKDGDMGNNNLMASSNSFLLYVTEGGEGE